VLGDDSTDQAGEAAARDVAPDVTILCAAPDGSPR
jgi:hypothetical protein